MKKSAYILLNLFFSLSVFCGVNLSPTTAQDNQLEQNKVVEFKTLAKNINGEEHEAKNMVIKNQEEWVKLWEALHINSSEKPELPAVDFKNRMVIAVFLGDKPNPGHNVAILETFKSNKKIMRVTYKVTTPGASCVHPQVLAQPYQIIETEKAKKVSFTLLQEVKDCKSK